MLKKIHLQPKNGFFSVMVEWMKGARRRRTELEENIKSLISKCACGDSLPPAPHPVASINFLEKKVQQSISIDCVFFEGLLAFV